MVCPRGANSGFAPDPTVVREFLWGGRRGDKILNLVEKGSNVVVAASMYAGPHSACSPWQHQVPIMTPVRYILYYTWYNRAAFRDPN